MFIIGLSSNHTIEALGSSQEQAIRGTAVLGDTGTSHAALWLKDVVLDVCIRIEHIYACLVELRKPASMQGVPSNRKR
jgi:hypothetical protein